MLAVSSYGLHATKQGHSLAWKWYDMFAPFFHPLGRNAPDSQIKIELAPLRFDHFGGARQGQPHQQECSLDLIAATVGVEITKQLANVGLGQRCLVLRLVLGERISSPVDGIAIDPERLVRELENAKQRSLGFRHDRDAVLRSGRLEHIQDHRRCDLADR